MLMKKAQTLGSLAARVVWVLHSKLVAQRISMDSSNERAAKLRQETYSNMDSARKARIQTYEHIQRLTAVSSCCPEIYGSLDARLVCGVGKLSNGPLASAWLQCSGSYHLTSFQYL